MPLALREEAKIWILANQLGRRNLTDAMHIEVALLSKTSKPENENVHVQKALAAEAGVGEGPLHRAENTFTENFTKYIVKHC